MRELTWNEIEVVNGAHWAPDFFPQFLIDDYLIDAGLIGLGIGAVTAALLNYYRPYGKTLSMQDTAEGILRTGLEGMQYGLVAWAVHSSFKAWF